MKDGRSLPGVVECDSQAQVSGKQQADNRRPRAMILYTLQDGCARHGVSTSPRRPSKSPERQATTCRPVAFETLTISWQFTAAQPDPPSNVEFHALDFFTFEVPEGGFDLCYDFTSVAAALSPLDGL